MCALVVFVCRAVLGSAFNVRVPSAKNKMGVQQAFEELTQKIFDTPDLLTAGSPSGGLKVGAGPNAGGGGGADGACSC